MDKVLDDVLNAREAARIVAVRVDRAVQTVAEEGLRHASRCMTWIDGHDPDEGEPRGLADPNNQRYVKIEIGLLHASMIDVLNALREE